MHIVQKQQTKNIQKQKDEQVQKGNHQFVMKNILAVIHTIALASVQHLLISTLVLIFQGLV